MLAALEIMFLMKELKELEGSKLDKVYSKNSEIILQLHKAGKGKVYLRIIPGEIIFITKFKESSEKPTNFAMSLRKYLGRHVIRKVKQVGFERIIEIYFDKHKVIIELFSKGNVVLVDGDNKIINLLSHQKWKDRILKVREDYKLPPERPDLFNLSFNEFKKIVEESERGSIVKILASDFGLGGKYAEEVCKRAKVKKNIRKVDLKLVYRAINSFRKDKIKAAITKDKKPMFLPTDLETYNVFEKVKFDSISKAIEFYLEGADKKENNSGKKKLLRIAEMQKEKIKELEKVSVEYKKIGDKIYHEYALLNDLIKKYKESKGNFKDKRVKDVDKAARKFVVEL